MACPGACYPSATLVASFRFHFSSGCLGRESLIKEQGSSFESLMLFRDSTDLLEFPEGLGDLRKVFGAQCREKLGNASLPGVPPFPYGKKYSDLTRYISVKMNKSFCVDFRKSNLFETFALGMKIA